LAFFAALAPFLAAISIGGYALVHRRQDILLWTLVPWAVCGFNVFAYVWAPRKLRISPGMDDYTSGHALWPRPCLAINRS